MKQGYTYQGSFNNLVRAYIRCPFGDTTHMLCFSEKCRKLFIPGGIVSFVSGKRASTSFSLLMSLLGTVLYSIAWYMRC